MANDLFLVAACVPWIWFHSPVGPVVSTFVAFVLAMIHLRGYQFAQKVLATNGEWATASKTAWQKFLGW